MSVHPTAILSPGATLGRGAVLGPSPLVEDQGALGGGRAGPVALADRASPSGGVVVDQFCRSGRLAMIGGNAKIVQDCLPFVITDGAPGRARGLNSVGLRRAGIGPAQVRALKEAYRLLLRSSLPPEAALERMAAGAGPLGGGVIPVVPPAPPG